LNGARRCFSASLPISQVSHFQYIIHFLTFLLVSFPTILKIYFRVPTAFEPYTAVTPLLPFPPFVQILQCERTPAMNRTAVRPEHLTAAPPVIAQEAEVRQQGSTGVPQQVPQRTIQRAL
jgi:hypothetical protein